LYFSLFYHLFYRITVIGWSALAVVSRYCQILLLLLLLLLHDWQTALNSTVRVITCSVWPKELPLMLYVITTGHNTLRRPGLKQSLYTEWLLWSTILTLPSGNLLHCSYHCWFTFEWDKACVMEICTSGTHCITYTMAFITFTSLCARY